MRRARPQSRSPALTVAVAASTLAGLAACGPDLPERMWRSEHVRYFSRDGDVQVCPAIVDEVEAHGAVLADLFGVPELQTPISYYKFDGEIDFRVYGGCGVDGVGCAMNATVRSPLDFDRHALVSAFMAPYGLPPPLLAEGVAAALACERHPRPTGSWREAYQAAPASPELRAAGAWLVGYMLSMFRATWLVNLYGSLQPNATADRFAENFGSRYEMPLDDVWTSAVNLPEQPMRCVWECGRPAIPADGQAHPLVAACETGSVQRSVEVSEGGVSRWRVDGAAGVRVRSCDGFDEPLIPIRGVNRPGVLVAPLKAGTYFADAVVEAGRAPVLAVSVAPAEGLWWTECAQAQPLADDLASLGSLSLFYPQSDVPRFTRFATGTDRQSDVLFRPPGVVSGSLCAECNSTVCDFFMGQQGYTPFILPGNVLQLAPSPAVTVSFHWR